VLLQTLDLSNNSFSNALPAVWGNLQRLVHLNISYNRFGGSLPLSWAALSNLQTLDMSNNTLQVRQDEQASLQPPTWVFETQLPPLTTAVLRQPAK
jgi:hypothetical protein